MNAKDLIETYVTEVAVHLPRKQRNDVAFELRALLHEELQAKAEATGRGADAAMATELLQAFGRPGEVAARYRPTLTIIDPADGRMFLRATVIGLAAIWFLGLLARLQQPVHSGSDLLLTVSHWWYWLLGTVIQSLWWPGVLVVGFGLSAWARRRRPLTAGWKPRPGDRIQGGRAVLVLGIVGILCGVYVLLEPRWVLDFFWGGQAAPAAYEALTYTDTFRARQAPWILLLLLLQIPLYLAVVARGRWSDSLRRLENGLSLAQSAALTWTVLDGPVFRAPASDRTVKFVLVAIAVSTLVGFAIRQFRRIRPSPETGVPAAR
jgi:hypothetical protein